MALSVACALGGICMGIHFFSPPDLRMTLHLVVCWRVKAELCHGLTIRGLMNG